MSFDRGAPALWFIEIFLDTETVRLCNAFEPVEFDGETYAAFGDRIRPPADIDRTASLKSQKFSIGFDSSRQTDNDDPIGIILDSNWRRRPVRVRYAVGDMGASAYDFSGAFILIDEAGRIKDTEDKIAAGRMPEIEIEIESGALIFLERRNQTRSPANQRAAFPDDAFFDYALKLDGVVLPWRTKKARNGKVQITYDIEGAAPREMLIGRGMTKGSFVFGATGGQQRKYWAQVYALADHRCEALEQCWINGTPVLNGITLSHGARTPLEAFRSSESGSAGIRLWMTWYDGRHDQSADSYLISLTAGQPLAWTINHRGCGVSYCIIEHLWDSDNPESYSYEFQLRGARIYQERFDTTAGGSGSQRWNNPDTWTYSTNPADAWRHFLRGRVLSPSSSAMWFGVGADPTFLDPFNTYKYQAEHCDELIALKLGGTQKRYEANGWITADTDHKTNLQKLADCAVADAVDEGSRVSIRLSEPQMPVIDLTDEDLDEAAESVIGANARSDDVVNRVEGRFQDPANKFQAVDYPAVADAAFEEIDGAEISETWNQPLEISEERAQRKALLLLNKRRRTVEIEERFGPKAKIVRPGDWLTRSSALRGFPDGKLFIADEVRRYADGTVRLVLLEVDPNEKVWIEESAELTPAGSDPEITPAQIGTPNPDILPVSVSSGGAILPGLTITRDTEADDLALEIEAEVALDNGAGLPAGIIKSYTLTARGEAVETITGLLPSTDYLVRFRYSDGLTRGPWGLWRPFTTTDEFQAAAALAPAPEGELAAALATATAARDTLAELILSLQVRLDETRENLADLGRINGVSIGTLIDQIQRQISDLSGTLAQEIGIVSARVDNAEAMVVAERLARIAGDAAAAAERALIAVRLMNAEALIQSERSARITANDAIAEDILALNTSIQDIATGQAGTAQALQGLTTRVRANERELVSQASSITSLASHITDQANTLTGQSSSIAALNSRVRMAENSVQAVSNSVTALSAEVSGLNANFGGLADALSVIEAAILASGGSIDISLSEITSLASQVQSIDGRTSGNTSAINALQSRVTANEGGIASVVTNLSSLTTNLGGLQAQVDILSGVAGNTQSGLSAFFGLRGKAGTSEFEFAAFAGTGAPSTITLSADQIRFNGQVIIDGTLTTTQLAPNAVTEKKLYTGSNVSLASNAAFTNVLASTIPTAGGTVELEYELDVILTAANNVGLRIEIVVNGSVVREVNYYLVGLFTHTVQGFARFACGNGDTLVIRAKVQRGEGLGQSGASVSNVTARSIEFKR